MSFASPSYPYLTAYDLYTQYEERANDNVCIQVCENTKPKPPTTTPPKPPTTTPPKPPTTTPPKPPTTTPPPSSGNFPSSQIIGGESPADCVRYINEYRAQRGLGPLKDAGYSCAAKAASLDKAAGKMHGGGGRANCGMENAGWNYRNYRQLVSGWIGSPAHERQLSSRQHTQISCGADFPFYVGAFR